MLWLFDLFDFVFVYEWKFCFDGLRDGEGERFRFFKF